MSITVKLQGEDFHRLFVKQAQLALKTANAASPEDWRKSGDEWTRLREEVGLEKEHV